MTSVELSSIMENILFDNLTFQNGSEDIFTNSSFGNFTPLGVEEEICVICRYYLQPWLKTLRVGFGSVIVLANIATFIMLLRARSIQLPLRYFLLNVAVVDCAYGAGFLYHSAIVDFPQFVLMNLECKLRYGGLCLVSMVALFTLMAMCVERVIALKCPFQYHLIVNRTTLLMGIFIFWAVPAAIVTPTYILLESVGECNFVRFISSESFVVFAVTYFMLMVVAVFCQLVLLFITKSHIRKILPTIVGDQKERAAFKMNLKATTTTLSLAVPFVICSAPKVLTYMFLAFNPRERIKVESLTLLAVTVYLNVSNSLVNPIVYGWRLPELRAQVLTLLGKRLVTSTFGSGEHDKEADSDGPMKPKHGDLSGTCSSFKSDETKNKGESKDSGCSGGGDRSESSPGTSEQDNTREGKLSHCHGEDNIVAIGSDDEGYSDKNERKKSTKGERSKVKNSKKIGCSEISENDNVVKEFRNENWPRSGDVIQRNSPDDDEDDFNSSSEEIRNLTDCNDSNYIDHMCLPSGLTRIIEERREYPYKVQGRTKNDDPFDELQNHQSSGNGNQAVDKIESEPFSRGWIKGHSLRAVINTESDEIGVSEKVGKEMKYASEVMKIKGKMSLLNHKCKKNSVGPGPCMVDKAREICGELPSMGGPYFVIH